jgi:hypothetical protein
VRGWATESRGEDVLVDCRMIADTENCLDLRQIQLADEYLATLAGNSGPNSRFRFKHADELDLSGLYALREHGIITDSERMGRCSDWRLTEDGELAVDRLQAGEYSDELLDALDGYSVDVLYRHLNLLLELPENQEFQAKEHEALCGSLLGALNRAGLLDRVEARIGEPDVWELSAFARLVTATASTNEASVESEGENE